MIKQIFTSAVSATFELDNNDIYYAKKAYDVYLDDVLILSQVKTNVFSVYDLLPKTKYVIKVNDMQFNFETEKASAIINVKDFNAKGDGENDDTLAIQTAFYACPKEGVVVIPEGKYLVSPLFLVNDITIYLKENAILLGETDRKKYPILPGSIKLINDKRLELSSWEGESKPTFASLITGLSINNVKFVGQGVIDEQAHLSDWWIDHKVMRGGAWRPKGVFLSQCSHISFQGLTIKNTPSWNLHPYFSQYINFIDLNIESPKDSPNTDGCNPEACSHVNVIGVKFSVGDDCIAIKSNKFDLGMKYKTPTSHMVVRNCLMQYGHGAVVLGSETSAGVKDLSVTQCYFKQTDRGLRIKTRRGRGKTSVIDGIVFKHIYMEDVLTPLVMNMYYFCDDDGKTEYVWSKNALPIDERTPYLGKFTFKDITCDGVHAAAGFFYGLPEQPIKSIVLDDVTFNFAENPIESIPAMMSFLEPMKSAGLQFNYVDHVKLNNVRFNGVVGKKVNLEHVKKYENEPL
jgi:polygalacturonase